MNNGNYLYTLFRRWGLSDFGARTAQVVVERPLRIVLIVIVAMVVARLGGRAIDRFVRSVHQRRSGTARSETRTETMAVALTRLVRLVTAIVASLLVLGVLGIDLAPLIAGASVAGVAVAFGAQSLVRDMLAGLFIIGEDQYGVGDIIDLGSAAGVVEEVSLRTTRVRAADGTVWFVPNGQVQRVGNSSMGFSGALVDIPLPFGVDLARAIAEAAAETESFAADPAWSTSLMQAPDVWGIHALSPDGPMLRIVLRTEPLVSGRASRELRRRVVDRLTAEGFRPPVGVAPSAAVAPGVVTPPS